MKSFFLLVLLLSIASCGSGDTGGPNGTQAEAGQFETEELVRRGDVVWGFDFIDDDQMIFTERSGGMGLLNLNTRQVTPLTGVPPVVRLGEGGLLDVRFHQGLIYLCHSETSSTGPTVSLTRARLQGSRLTEVTRLFSANETSSASIHWGCRIEFDRTNHLYLSLGDRNQRERAQDLAYHQGKILRLNLDGTAPSDNPFVATPGARAEIFSLGHRNVQGLAFEPGTGVLWASELGPRGGDEINRIQSGQNYGWPLISFGTDSGGVIEATSRPGYQDPVLHWDPSISPSGIAFYQGDLYLANLSGRHVRKLSFENGQVTTQEELFKEKNLRFRNLRAGPAGRLYFSTDDGVIGRISNSP